MLLPLEELMPFATATEAVSAYVLDDEIAYIAQPAMDDRNIYSVYKPADLLLEVV